MLITLRQIQYFDALMRSLHFRQAAVSVGVTQPALSAQIAELEARLGVKLFERGAGPVRPTADALYLRPRIEAILAQVRDLELVSQRGRPLLEGPLTLGVIPTVAPYFLPYALPLLRERFGRLRLRLREALTDTLVEDTIAGRVDGFIAAEPQDSNRLVSQLLFEDRFMLAVPAADADAIGSPVRAERLEAESLMLLEEGHCLRDQALAVCGQAKPTVRNSFGATSLTTLLQMVEHGMGATLIPEIAAASAAGHGNISIMPFGAPAPSRRICLAWNHASPRGEEFGLLAQTLRDAYRNLRKDRERAA